MISKPQKIIAIFLIVACLLAGVYIEYIGISDLVHTMKVKADCTSTTGVLTDYEIVSTTPEATYYYLFYTYTVDGKEYRAKTEYQVDALPAPGEEKTVWYPTQGVRGGVVLAENDSGMLVIIGSMFIFVPLIMAFAIIKASRGGAAPIDPGFIEQDEDIFIA